MDPDKLLSEIRTLAQLVNDGLGPDNTIDAAGKMAECFDALDGWLNKGGFLPTDWNALHRCGSPTKESLEPHVRKGTLGDTQAALQAVGNAVRQGDRDTYLRAVNAAYRIGCSIEQVEDAYRFPAGERYVPLRFDIAGNPSSANAF